MMKKWQQLASAAGVWLLGCMAAQAEIPAMNPLGKIYPTPQKISLQMQSFPVNKDNVNVVLYGDVTEPMAYGVEIYRNALAALPGSAAAVKLQIEAGLMREPELVKLFGGAVPLLPEQGYALKLIKSDANGAVIALAGADERGVMFGFASLAQLLQSADGGAVQNIMDVEDYPLWKHRFISDYFGRQTAEGYKFAAACKISGTAMILQSNWRKPEWWAQNAGKFAEIKQLADAGIMEFMALPHIYTKNEGNVQLNIADQKQLDEFTESCRKLAASGITYIMVGADDLTPVDNVRGFEPFFQEEKDQFHNSIGEAHGYLMKYLYEKLHPEFPELKLSFVGAPYGLSHGVGRPVIDKYIVDWGKTAPQEVMWVWTGARVFSKEVNSDEIAKLNHLLSGQQIYLFDNSNGYHSPLPRWETTFYPGMEQDNASLIYLNGCFFWENCRNHEALRFLTTCDYLWNPADYNAENSYNTALTMLFGADVVAPVNKMRNIMAAYDDVEYSGFKADLTANLDEYAKSIEAVKQLAPGRKGYNLLTSLGIPRVDKKLERVKSLVNNTPPAVKVPKQTEPIRFDGVIAPGEWDNAARIELTNTTADSDAAAATVKLAYTPEGLYLAFDIPSKEPLPANTGLRLDDAVYGSAEAVEIFLQFVPVDKDNLSGYLHYCFDYSGNKFDETACNGGVFWNGDWEVRTAPTATGWSAEVLIKPTVGTRSRYAIQVEDTMYDTEVLPGNAPAMPAPGVVWKANIHRVDNRSGLVQSWNPGGFKFHLPAFFGTLNLE